MQEKDRSQDERGPGQVISWLRSGPGERWAAARVHGLNRHDLDDGVMASVLSQPVYGRRAQWPEPFRDSDLDVPPGQGAWEDG